MDEQAKTPREAIELIERISGELAMVEHTLRSHGLQQEIDELKKCSTALLLARLALGELLDE